MKLLRLLVVPLVLSGAVAIWLLPDLVHAFDSARVEMRIEDLVAGARPSSRLLTVVGMAATVMQVTEDHREKDGHSSGVVLYVPIVPKDWTPAEPVHVVLKTHYWGLQELERDPRHDGVLRNVLWEGLSSGAAGYFTDHLHLTLAPDVLLLDGESRGWSLRLCLAAMGAVFLLSLLLTWNATRKRA